MDREQKIIRLGCWVILGALALRLLVPGLPALLELLTSSPVVELMVFLETGRVVRTSPAETETTAPATLPTEEPTPTSKPTTAPTTTPTEPELPPAVAVFSHQDAALVEVNSACGYDADIAGSLQKELSWDLTAQSPSVLIIHSHGTESYTPTGEYQESSAYRTRDPGYNVISIGDRLVQVLESQGIHAVHDRTAHDDPSYNAAYSNARESIEAYLKQYPTIKLVLDIHRDSVENADGQQLRFVTETPQGTAAQLMLVVGSDASGLSHSGWPENMSLAVKLHALLEKQAPGICRPISFRSQRFNQDLSPGALIVEVGSAGNSRQEALAAVEQLGQAIAALAYGSRTIS